MIADPACSRVHGRVDAHPGGWTWTNLSNEGTYLDGRKVGTQHFDERISLRLGHPVAGPEPDPRADPLGGRGGAPDRAPPAAQAARDRRGGAGDAGAHRRRARRGLPDRARRQRRPAGRRRGRRPDHRLDGGPHRRRAWSRPRRPR
ncbi:FHA domain-containing protein [Nocardioides sp. W3-2-3]|uniref:FHA domain-containing protein n=1 Tax=Nocardioides convexus TaxID=2712224 RepID=UPI0024181F36|nr:FHA domain-containing protein [Nocardioides convexus]NHA00161.1 FHA domain-containing protein [Nocardioides convexus]